MHLSVTLFPVHALHLSVIELYFIVIETLLLPSCLLTLTLFMAGHYWCLSVSGSVCCFVFVYACVRTRRAVTQFSLSRLSS